MIEPVRQSTAEVGLPRLFGAVTRWSSSIGTATAAAAQDGIMSFAGLGGAARLLAGSLAAEGVGRGTRVGLFLGRSRAAMAGFLAVWWLGGTAVPMDERHPADRLNFALRDAGVRFVLARPLPAGVAPQRVRRIDPDIALASGGTRPGPGTVPGGPEPDDIAYVIYTSGSTGWPKGVEVTYRNLEVFLGALGSVGLRPGGMGVNAVSPAFDGWLWCALLYLLHGQGMAIVDLAARSGTAAGLTGLVETHAPGTVCLTPTLFAALERIPPADVLVVAGEPCPPGLLQRLAGQRRVLNVYGPTEATIAATWADTARGDDLATIGRPMHGYLAYVLDDAGRRAGTGTAGELCLGGAAIARGYRNRPGLTAARFVPDPFIGRGARMYRTGDVVRARPDGQLEFLGRRDDQVKVRGHRVELAEIERVAAERGGVRAAAAFVTATDAVGLAVVGTSAAGDGEWAARVRAQCASRLPAAMVPAVVDVVPALPMLPSGKVDRAALARASVSAGSAAGRQPGTARERLVCQTFGELLERPVGDADADFFALGGHSLLAARAVAALRRATGLPLSMRHLLANPTASALAAEMDRLARPQAGGS